VTQNSGGLRVTTSGGWAGRVELVARGYIVCIQDGVEAGDDLRGYRVFGIDRVSEIGDEFFVIEPKRLASPRRQTAVARARV
jgi:hypothetical protein